jgi:SEC-C motif-containing protein
MRSRYTAYVNADAIYLRDTLAPETRADFNIEEAKAWAKESEWLGLKIVRAEDDVVEFTAKYRTQGKVIEHHEVSKFKKIDGRWFFLEGDSHVHEDGKGHDHTPKAPVVREAPKIGRNDPCSCGSGKKFKKCCALSA